jgi:hypothetical protein
MVYLGNDAIEMSCRLYNQREQKNKYSSPETGCIF